MDEISFERAAAAFPSTLWTQILEAKTGDDSTRRKALDQLFRAYWRPLYAAIRFGWNRSHEETKDYTQAFLTDLIEREFWKNLDPSLGKFRSFLKAAARNFMMNEVDARACLKRGGGRARVPLDEIQEIPNPSLPGTSPEGILDEEWIHTVLSTALDQLKKEYPPEEGHAYFDVIRLYYLEGTDRPTYADVARKLNLTETSVRYYLSEAKVKLRKIVSDIVRQYSSSDGDVEQEVQFILG